MRDFTLAMSIAARAMSTAELSALPAAALDAVYYGHLAWCDNCNYDREGCACEYADEEFEEVGDHRCNCPDGWGGRLRTLIREKRLAETGSPHAAGGPEPRVECGVGADGRLVVRVYPVDQVVELTIDKGVMGDGVG